MFENIITSRFVWDIYAEIAAAKYAKSGSHPDAAAKSAAAFADQMCIERARRFPTNDSTSTKKGK